jgi:hypothetical protein
VSGLARASNVSEGTISDVLSGATGSGIGNYNVSYSNGTLTIDPAALTVTGSSRSTTYTSNQLVNSAATMSGLQGSDSFTISGYGSGTTVGSYADSLTLSAASGTDANNYTISLVGGTLTVTPAPLTVSGGTTRLTYNGSQQTNSFTVSGLLGNDTVTGVSGLARASNVSEGTISDVLSGATGSGIGNYNVSYSNGTLTIDPAALTVTYMANEARSPYGSSLSDLSGTVVASGFVGGDGLANLRGTVVWATTATSNSPVGRYAITGSGLTSSSNYSIVGMQASGNSTAYIVTGDTNVSPAGTPVALTATQQSTQQIPETKPSVMLLSSSDGARQTDTGNQKPADSECPGGGDQNAGGQSC